MLDAWSSSQLSVVPFRICQRLRRVAHIPEFARGRGLTSFLACRRVSATCASARLQSQSTGQAALCVARYSAPSRPMSNAGRRLRAASAMASRGAITMSTVASASACMHSACDRRCRHRVVSHRPASARIDDVRVVPAAGFEEAPVVSRCRHALVPQGDDRGLERGRGSYGIGLRRFHGDAPRGTVGIDAPRSQLAGQVDEVVSDALRESRYSATRSTPRPLPSDDRSTRTPGSLRARRLVLSTATLRQPTRARAASMAASSGTRRASRVGSEAPQVHERRRR